MGCASGICRYLLFIFNFLFCLCGIALIVVGSLLIKNNGGTVKGLVEGDVDSLSIVLIIVGVATFVIAFCGCCGSIRENHCMLITFSILLLTIFIIHLVISIYAFVNRDSFQDYADKTITDLFEKETDKDVWIGIENSLKCCGVKGPEIKYFTQGCCINYPDGSCNIAEKAKVWQQGCASAFKDFMRSGYIIIGGVSIGIAFIEICGVIIGLSIANSIKRQERRNY